MNDGGPDGRQKTGTPPPKPMAIGRAINPPFSSETILQSRPRMGRRELLITLTKVCMPDLAHDTRQMSMLGQSPTRTTFAEMPWAPRNGISSFGGTAWDHLAASSDR